MRKIIVIFILLTTFPLFAEPVIEEPVYHESSFRRAETVFFLSVPFTMIAGYLLAYTTYLIAESGSTADTLPNEYFLGGMGAALGMSAGIAWYDYHRMQSDQRTEFSYSYRF